MIDDLKIQLSDPIYLRLKTTPFDNTRVSIREYCLSSVSEHSDSPLLLLTFHPGYLTGSYQNRDYFERLASVLYQTFEPNTRLRIFTINHPGYDLPIKTQVDRFQLEPFRICHQPLALEAALSWLVESYLAHEKEIVWLGYGHSMGGLALSQFQPTVLQARFLQNGRSLHVTKILSAPALCLHPKAKALLSRLDLLHNLKQTVGRLPLYNTLATGLYRVFAPFYYQRDADQFSIQSLREFNNYRQLNPFVLLEQGRDLLRVQITAVDGAVLLANTHIILARRDGMIDVPATIALIENVKQQGHDVMLHHVDSTHLLELDASEAIAPIVYSVTQAAQADIASESETAVGNKWAK